MDSTIEIIDYDPSFAEETVVMWRKSKREALGDYVEPHDFDSFLTFLRENLEKTHIIKLAINSQNRAVVGFLALQGEELDQIYIDPQAQGKGIGRAFMEMAKNASPKRLLAYTFQCNIKAQKFYEKHGFHAIKYGTVNEENLPDILYEWKARNFLRAKREHMSNPMASKKGGIIGCENIAPKQVLIKLKTATTIGAFPRAGSLFKRLLKLTRRGRCAGGYHNICILRTLWSIIHQIMYINKDASGSPFSEAFLKPGEAKPSTS